MPLASAAVWAFVALTCAAGALWLPRVSIAGIAPVAWPVFLAAALVAAMTAGLVDVRGLLLVLLLAGLCVAARRAVAVWTSVAAHAAMLAMCAACFLHLLPGFDNPRVLADVVLSPDSAPYTKYLNFDKGIAGLFLLGLYAPDRPLRDEGGQHVLGLLWRLALVTVAVMVLTLLFGYVRWDPKLPSWWPMWLWSMVFLTALPEEALFRGVVQELVAGWLVRHASSEKAPLIAALVVGLVFGLAHGAGGASYVVLASCAGIGYGWIYVRTRSIGATILAHAGLNTIHLLFFSYPALR